MVFAAGAARLGTVDWKPRLIDHAELDTVIDLSTTVFGEGPAAPDFRRRELRAVIEVDRTFVVDDGEAIAGTGGSFTFDLALPGTTLPISGVTEVGVLPTHRRQGVLTALMGALLDQAVEHGEPLAGLTASEGTIYRRYGYGVAARRNTLLVDTTRSAELVDIAAPGRLRLLTVDRGAPLLPAVWEQHWRRTPGEVNRNQAWWEILAMDPEQDRDGDSALYLVVHEDEAGVADGFAAYRLKDGFGPAHEWFELHVIDFGAADDGVEAALLRYLLDVDLVRQVRWRVAPTDLALRWRLVDARAIQVVREVDHLWLRPLDIPRCLTARSYAAEGGGVVEVVDGRRPEVGGRFALDAGPDGADCVRVTVEPDVTLDVADLGSLLLSGVSWAELQRAGLVDEHLPGTVDRLDALFRPRRAPHCSTGF